MPKICRLTSVPSTSLQIRKTARKLHNLYVITVCKETTNITKKLLRNNNQQLVSTWCDMVRLTPLCRAVGSSGSLIPGSNSDTNRGTVALQLWSSQLSTVPARLSTAPSKYPTMVYILCTSSLSHLKERGALLGFLLQKNPQVAKRSVWEEMHPLIQRISNIQRISVINFLHQIHQLHEMSIKCPTSYTIISSNGHHQPVGENLATTRLRPGRNQPGGRNASPKRPHRKHRPGEVIGKIHYRCCIFIGENPFFSWENPQNQKENLENDGKNVGTAARNGAF